MGIDLVLSSSSQQLIVAKRKSDCYFSKIINDQNKSKNNKSCTKLVVGRRSIKGCLYSHKKRIWWIESENVAFQRATDDQSRHILASRIACKERDTINTIEVCTWFVLHNYCTPKKLDVISISHASRWVVTEYALTALYLKMYTPSKLSVCFNLNLNSYVIIQWTAICSITYPYHWAK